MRDMIAVVLALGQETRLEALTLLSCGPADGQTSGDLALQAGVTASSMSTHLAILAAAGLVSSVKSGRNVTYRIERGPIGSALSNLAARTLDDGRTRYVGSASIIDCWSPVAGIYRGSQAAVAGRSSATRAILARIGRAIDAPAAGAPGVVWSRSPASVGWS